MSTVIEKQSLRKVMVNLNKEIKGIEKRTMKGFIEGAMIVRKDMDKTPPLIPIGDTENLRGSWFTESVYQGKNPVLFLGFQADYALYVHEMYGPTKAADGKVHFQRPGAGAGFFVGSLKRNKRKVLTAIKNATKVKK